MPRRIVQEITAVDKTAKAFASVQQRIGGLKAVFAGLGAAVSVGAFAGFIRESIDAADNIQKLSVRLGASTEALSQYQYVAERSGVSFRTLTQGFQRMTRRISEAAQGSGEAKDALRELGLDAERLNALRPAQQFEQLADALTRVEAPADRVRLAMRLFDSEGVALLQTMEDGAAGIRALRDEADALGLTLNQDTAKVAENVNDSLAKLGAIAEALGVTLINALGPAIEATVTWLADALPSAARFAYDAFYTVQEFILRSVAKITGALSKFYGFIAGLADAVGADYFRDLNADAAEFLAGISSNSEKAAIRVASMNTELEQTRVEIQTGITFQGAYNRAIAETFAREKALEGTAKGRAAALREQTRAIREAEQAEQEWQEKLQAVIDDVDPVAPLRRQLEELERLADKFPQYADIIGDAMLNIHEQMDEIGNSVDENNTKIQEGISIAKDFGATFSSAFEDAIVNGKGLSDILKGLEKDLIRIITQTLVTNPLAGAVTNLFSPTGAGGGFLNNIFGNLFRASGGPVMAGVPYVVGEAGPELVVPKSSGTVIPNGQLGGVVNVYVNAPAGASPEAYRLSARQGALEGSRMLQRGQGIR